MKYTFFALTVLSFACNGMEKRDITKENPCPTSEKKSIIPPLIATQMTLSLLDAIMFGAIKADKGVIKYNDFEKPDVSYQTPLPLVPQIIYSTVAQATEKAENSSGNPTQQLASRFITKLTKNPSRTTSAEELLPRQYIRFAGFYCALDLLEQTKMYSNEYAKHADKNRILADIDDKISAVYIYRSLLHAALATMNEEAINTTAKGTFHLERNGFKNSLRLIPLVQDIEEERKRCQHIHDNPLTHDCVPQ
jgi:hypothetical protein